MDKLEHARLHQVTAAQEGASSQPSLHARIAELEAERDRYKGYGSLDIDRLLKERDKLRAALLNHPLRTKGEDIWDYIGRVADWIRANVEPLK